MKINYYLLCILAGFVMVFSIMNCAYQIEAKEKMTLEETKVVLGGDPYKIAQWMAQNVKTSTDTSGFTQPPERMFKWKKGDCEDWAVLSKYFLEGFHEEVLLIIWRGKFRKDSKYYTQMRGRLIDHCVVAVFDGIKWGIIDQDKYIHSDTLPDIIKLNCDLRRIKVEKAFIVDFLKYRRKKIGEIDLNE